VTRTLAPIACAGWLLWACAAGASPFEWEIAARPMGGPLVLAEAELGVAGAGEDWIVHATAVFVPDSGATTFLEELDQPRPDDSSLDPTPVPSGHLQPLPAFETRGRPLPALPAVAHARIRYRGEASAMLPLSLGVLGLIVVGRKPNRARAR